MSQIIAQTADKIADLPCIAFIKDKEHTLLATSHYLANLAGYSERKAVEGKNDFQLCWEHYAPRYWREDDRVMNGENIIGLETINDHSGNVYMIMVKKRPIIAENGNILGVLGVAEIVQDRAFIKKFNQFMDLDLENCFIQTPNIYEFSAGPAYLTKAEFKVLFYYVRGYTMRAIAETLHRSSRTVESHLSSIKTKLNAQNRQQLFDHAIELGLIHLVPLDL